MYILQCKIGGVGGVRPARTTSAWLPEAGGWIDCPVYDRTALRPGRRLPGPAIIAERESTTLLPAGDTASVTPHGNLVIEVAAPEPERGARGP